MSTAHMNWLEHPGVHIKEEMETRGWLQRDLAFILGAPEQAVNAILSGRRGITAEMAMALGEAFDVPGEFFANLQQAYDMARAKVPYQNIAQRRELSTFPMREMIQRGWIDADQSMLESSLMRFFGASSLDEIPYMAHAAKKTRYEELKIRPAQLAWLFRVRQIARSIAVPKYSEAGLRSALKTMESLLVTPEEARHVPKILMECGVRFVLVERLPKAEIDGVCFWIDGSPVIGMSVQRDKIDNFWFVLRHECEHVLRRDGQEEEIIDESLVGENASTTSPSISTQERAANAAASDFCVSTEKLDSFMARKHPFYYEKDVIAFAQLQRRHPGLVVGQMQYRMNRYDYLTRYLVKIRQFVLPAAIADGWGQLVPVSL